MTQLIAGTQEISYYVLIDGGSTPGGGGNPGYGLFAYSDNPTFTPVPAATAFTNTAAALTGGGQSDDELAGQIFFAKRCV
jgi:hypothetical protein